MTGFEMIQPSQALDYSRYTVEKAKAEIERERRAGSCGADDQAIPESEITTDRMEIR